MSFRHIDSPSRLIDILTLKTCLFVLGYVLLISLQSLYKSRLLHDPSPGASTCRCFNICCYLYCNANRCLRCSHRQKRAVAVNMLGLELSDF